MRVVKLTTVALILMTAQCLLAQAAPAPSSNQAAPPAVPVTLDQVIDRVIQREHEQVKALSQYAPISETYIQRMRRGPEDIYEPGGDEYFLGKLDLENGNFDDTLFTATQGNHNGMAKRHFWNVFRSSLQFNAAGFAYEIFPDQNELDRQHYAFTYIQREFLGEVRTLVFDVAPLKHAGNGRFLGRIWVEDKDFSIVRFNGTYIPKPKTGMFFHFDSWRLNVTPNLWAPAYIYSEESDAKYGSKGVLAFKADIRTRNFPTSWWKAPMPVTRVPAPKMPARWNRSAPLSSWPPITWCRNWNALACWPRPATSIESCRPWSTT